MNSDLHSIISLLVLGLIVVMPVWDYFEVKKLRRHCGTKDRLRYYAIILFAHFVLGAGAIYCLRGQVLGANGALEAAEGMIANPWVRFPLLIMSVSFCLLALYPLVAGTLRPKAKARYTRAVSKTPFAFMFPSTRAERSTFAAMSISAGVWEEIIFRSFLVYYFSASLFRFDPLVSLALASVLFGVNHAYQGWVGVIRTAVVGFLFGLLYFTTGSLVLAMVVHAAIDLTALFMYRPDLLDAGPSAGYATPQAAAAS